MAGEIGAVNRPTTTGRLPAVAPRPAETPATTDARRPAPADRNTAISRTGELPTQAVDVDDIDLPGAIDTAKTARDNASDANAVAEAAASALKASDKVGDTLGKATKGLGIVGVATSFKGLADAFAKSPIELGLVATAMAELGTNLADAAGELEKIPGLANALKVFGGVGGMVSGIMQGLDEIKSMQENGLTVSNGLGAFASLANTLGGAAMAIAPFLGPVGLGVGAVGGALMLAGSAANLTKLAVDNWDAVKEGAATATNAVAGAAESVTTTVASAADAVGSGIAGAWNWLTS